MPYLAMDLFIHLCQQQKTTLVKSQAPTKDFMPLLMPDAKLVEDKRKMAQLKVRFYSSSS